MRLSTEATAAFIFIQGLQTSVERVMVDYHGMELHWDTLLRYDGRGQCEERYGDQLAVDLAVGKYGDPVGIKRKNR